MFIGRLTGHPLIATLRGLRGNVRGVVLTEPLWGIPYNLYAPYASVYMLALGLSDSQIGLIASIGLIFQFFWTIVSGALTDKFGRKRTTLVTDIIAWSIPCLIWAVAQDFNYFLIAAIINSIWRVTHNSWLCLVVEDTDPHILVDVYSLIYISGLLAAFFSPLTGLMISAFSLTPTMRGLYLLAFVMMTTKFLTMNALVVEPQQGRIRMQETQHQSLFAIVHESRTVLRQILRSPQTLITGGLMVIVTVCTTINTMFWSILVTERLQIASEYLSLYYVARSVIMLLVYFLLMPRLRTLGVHRPIVLGIAGLVLSWLILIALPPHSYLLLLVVTTLEGLSVPALSTFLDTLVATSVDPKERARIVAILYMAVIMAASPFGWIAGQLSEINRILPFLLNISLFIIGGFLAYFASRRTQVVE